MVIKARYEKGVFKPLEEVPVKEGTIAEVHPPREKTEEKKQRSSLKDHPAYGMWADRKDFKDGADYVNKIRQYRRSVRQSRG